MSAERDHVDFRVIVYTSSGWIEVERRRDGASTIRRNGWPLAGEFTLPAEEVAALHRAIQIAEADPVLPP